MDDNDLTRFAALMTGIADYYGKELSNGVIKLYWQGLRQFDLSAVEKALWEHTQNPDSGQFMPKIADVTRILQGRTVDQAQIAWAKVDRAVRMVGPYQDIAFDDPIIHRVLSDMGGWMRMGEKSEDEWPFVAKEFENRYRGFRLRGEVPEYPPVLTGIANAHNSRHGYSSQPVVLIGNQMEAKRVMIGGSERPMLEMNRVSDIKMLNG